MGRVSLTLVYEIDGHLTRYAHVRAWAHLSSHPYYDEVRITLAPRWQLSNPWSSPENGQREAEVVHGGCDIQVARSTLCAMQRDD